MLNYVWIKFTLQATEHEDIGTLEETKHVACVVVVCRHVQYYAMIGGPSTLWDCGTPRARDDDVVVQYSVNAGECSDVFQPALWSTQLTLINKHFDILFLRDHGCNNSEQLVHTFELILINSVLYSLWFGEILNLLSLCTKTSESNGWRTRNTLCGTWYLPHSHVYNERTVPIIMAGCMAHARNGYISTSCLKSDVTIVFLDCEFLLDAKISAIQP